MASLRVSTSPGVYSNFDSDVDPHCTFHFKVDPDLAFHFSADDTAYQNYADPANYNDKDQDPAFQ
jgi:hypothetical protein